MKSAISINRQTNNHSLSFRSDDDSSDFFHIDGLDLADGRDEDELEYEKGEKAGSDDGKQELLQAGEDFAASAWLFEHFFLDGHVAVVLDSRHFLLASPQEG